MPAKASHLEQLLALLREKEPSLIQAGIDEQGELYLMVERADLTDAQRERLVFLMVSAAGELAGGSLGAVLN
jgi:hypothetical protein